MPRKTKKQIVREKRNKRMAYTAGILALVILLAGSAKAATSVDFMSALVERTSDKIVEVLQSAGLLNTASFEEEALGAGAHAKTGKQAAAKSITTLVASTTIENTDTGRRIIDSIRWYASTTASAPTTTFNVCKSSSTSGCDTTMFTVAVESRYTDATYATLLTTSTFTSTSLRVWENDDYINCYVSSAVSTTEGFCAVEYYKP